MTNRIKEILQNSFYQLLIVYTLLVFFISINLYWKYALHFEIFAVILAILGFFILKKETKLSKNKFFDNKIIHYSILSIALLITFTYRIIPYLINSIPLGYDAGIYKYIIEYGLQNLDKWILQGVEPGFIYSMAFLSQIFSTNFILIWLFILFNLILGLAIYFVTKEYFNKTAALFAILLFAFSIIQFKTFELMYYKNIISLSLMLFSIYFLKKQKYAWFVIFGALTGMIHRPTFYIFGLSYFTYAFINPLKNKKYNFELLKKNIILGVLILLLALIPYLGKFSVALTSVMPGVLEGFIQPGQSPGTFINFFTYQFTTLAYLPFAILGFFYLARKKQFNILFLWALINALIVYFQFFFFNRFIIHLDIILIILASVGFCLIIEKRKKFGTIIVVILLISMAIPSFQYSLDSKPLFNEEELSVIKQLSQTEKNASVISLSGYYSPLVLGYSQRKTIAPGLFDYDNHTEEQWNDFWETQDLEKIKEFLNIYEKPLYIFTGKYPEKPEKKFDNSCFQFYAGNTQTKIYKYVC